MHLPFDMLNISYKGFLCVYFLLTFPILWYYVIQVLNNEVTYIMKCAIGQDSHKFSENADKKLILAGVHIKNHPGLIANSDGDVIYHALTNAISGITSVNILGKTADILCKGGITDSSLYVKEALKSLEYKIEHVSFTVECMTPVLSPYIEEMKGNIAMLLGIDKKDVGLTATSGEGLSSFGKGSGIMCFCIITVS